MAKARKKARKAAPRKKARKAPRKAARKGARKAARKTKKKAAPGCKLVMVCGKRRRICFKKKRIKGVLRMVISSNKAA